MSIKFLLSLAAAVAYLLTLVYFTVPEHATFKAHLEYLTVVFLSLVNIVAFFDVAKLTRNNA